jgi:multiple sugar transport system substrate-binding protein
LFKSPKRVVSVLIALVVAGCSGGASPSAIAPAASGNSSSVSPGASSADTGTIDGWAAAVKAKYGGTTLQLAFAAHPSTDAFKKMADDFTAKTGINLKWEVVEGAALKPKQLLEVTGHTGRYDVLMVDGVFWTAEYVTKNVLAPLDTYLSDPNQTPAWYDYKDLLPSYRSLGANGDKIYGVPSAGETRLLAYRQDLFSKYNIAVPKTTDELLAAATALNGKEPGTYGICLRGQKGIYFASGWLTLVYAFGPGFIDQKTMTSRMDAPDVKQSLEYFNALLKQAPPDVLNYTHEESTSAFISGKCAIWWDATALVSRLEDPAQSKIVGKVAYAPPPVGPAGAFAPNGGWTLGISADSKNKDAAWAFIAYMTSKAEAKTYLADGGPPSRTSILTDPAYQAADKSSAAQVETFKMAQNLIDKGISWVPVTPVIDKFLDRIGTDASLPLATGMSVDEALKLAQTEGVSILSEQ